MKLPILLVAIAVLIFYIIVPMLVWFFARHSKIGKILTIICAVLFVAILFFGITSEISINQDFAKININFSNHWCGKKINFSLADIDKFDFIINITMLFPIGLLVVYFNKKSMLNKFIALVVWGFATGLLLETLQFVLPVYRSVQLSDVLLNALSVLIGGGIGMIYDKIFVKHKN